MDDFDPAAGWAGQSQTGLFELKAEVRRLRERVERQAVVIRTLQAVLLEHAGMSADEFLDRLRDAVADRAEANGCRQCGKPISPKHTKCMYCGTPRPPELV